MSKEYWLIFFIIDIGQYWIFNKCKFLFPHLFSKLKKLTLLNNIISKLAIILMAIILFEMYTTGERGS